MFAAQVRQPLPPRYQAPITEPPKPYALGKTAQVLSTAISAGGSVPYTIEGESFYMVAASAALNIRPAGGAWNPFVPGTGLKIPGGGMFKFIEVQNPNNYPVSFSLFVGFGEYIDKRLISNSSFYFPTTRICYSPTPPVAGPINIPDLSGGAFYDLNGVQWLALYRIAAYFDNLDLNDNYIIQNAASSGAIAGTVFPQTTRTLASSGNFSLLNGAGIVNCAVQELYMSIAPTIL
jgi:hypothetical protein